MFALDVFSGNEGVGSGVFVGAGVEVGDGDVCDVSLEVCVVFLDVCGESLDVGLLVGVGDLVELEEISEVFVDEDFLYLVKMIDLQTYGPTYLVEVEVSLLLVVARTTTLRGCTRLAVTTL